MDESNLEAEHALPRRLVDQLSARVGQMRESGANVVDLGRDVGHSATAGRQKAAAARVLAQRPEELGPPPADPDGCGLDALLLHARAMLEPGAEQALVRVERTVEILDC